jgi:hypothetical protein
MDFGHVCVPIKVSALFSVNCVVFSAVAYCMYSDFGRYSDPLNFSTLCYVTVLFKNALNSFPPSTIHTQHPIMTKQKQFLGKNLAKKKNKK